MSRCSLRLDNSLPISSSSFSVGASSRSRSLRLRRSSLSESLLRPPAGRSSLLSSSSDVSDASLLSSLLDESSFQESTLLQSFWGLDHDVDANGGAIVSQQTAAHVTADVRPPCRSYCDSSSEETETCTIYTRGRSRRSRTDVVLSGVQRSSRAAAHFLSLPVLTCWAWLRSKVTDGGGASCDLDATMTPEDEGHAHDSLCDDCQEKQRLEVVGSSVVSRLLELTCSAALLTGQVLSGTGTLLSWLWPVVCRFSCYVWSVGCAAGGTLIGYLRRLCVHCHDTFAVWRPLLVIPLLLLLIWLCCFGLSFVFPSTKNSEQSAVAHVPETSSRPPGGGAEKIKAAESAFIETSQHTISIQQVTEDQSERLGALERRLDALVRRVELGSRGAELRNRKLLMELQQERHMFVESTMERRLEEVQTLLEETRQQSTEQLFAQDKRLERLELLLETMSDASMQLQQSGDASTQTLPTAHRYPPSASKSPPLSISTSSHSDLLSAAGLSSSHHALLAEFSRLETSLEDVKREVKSLKCEDVCLQLTAIQQMVSTQLSSQLRPHVLTLLYGRQSASGYAVTPESLLQWISERYVSISDLQEALLSMKQSILLSISAERVHRDTVQTSEETAADAVTSEEVRLIVSDALRRFSEDRTGMADYALESGGGTILSTRCSETYETNTALLTLFGFPLWYFSQSPRVVIQPNIHLGNCWPFRGSSGFLVIRLSMEILPLSFSLEHIPKALTADGKLLSAPRDFEVYGLHGEAEEDGTLLGTFTYEQDGDALQTFSVMEENHQTFHIIELKVLSNWGHPVYTCLYRFRVHGTPSST
ncbi:SUN domain-containing protein 1-like isoform X2 [Gouania willdenowi]|uniref:SUN domain-containing protein 1-like isoform X2 n=1 Tax=Gouania willdenowi TaxID=441366 RepID=UPI001054A917|nr:SUN domain-containing protein 1-like isoform X2 [Gouania willdenowi]